MSLERWKASKRTIGPKSIISASGEEMALELLVGLQEKQVNLWLPEKDRQEDPADDGGVAQMFVGCFRGQGTLHGEERMVSTDHKGALLGPNYELWPNFRPFSFSYIFKMHK